MAAAGRWRGGWGGGGGNGGRGERATGRTAASLPVRGAADRGLMREHGQPLARAMLLGLACVAGVRAAVGAVPSALCAGGCPRLRR